MLLAVYIWLWIENSIPKIFGIWQNFKIYSLILTRFYDYSTCFAHLQGEFLLL